MTIKREEKEKSIGLGSRWSWMDCTVLKRLCVIDDWEIVADIKFWNHFYEMIIVKYRCFYLYYYRLIYFNFF